MPPMKILAIETSCDQGSVALLIDGAIEQRPLPGAANHSRHVLTALGALLAEAGCSLGSLDALAFGTGPGAFTGLRLACGVAQGLALGSGLGIVEVGSLEALAVQFGDAAVYCATDARMGEIYCAAYRVRGTLLETMQAPRCMRPEAASIPAGDGWRGVGSAFAAYAEQLSARWEGRLSSVAGDCVPEAGGVARLACGMLERGWVAAAPEAVSPLYIRDKVALTTAERLARGGRS